MPKIKFIALLIAIALLMVLMGCGTGDKGGVERFSPLDLVTAGSGTDNGAGGGGGGGGGATGACVVQNTYCVNNVNATFCTNASGQLNAGTTCQNLLFTNCQTTQGYEVCY